MDVSVIIVNYNSLSVLQRCLESLAHFARTAEVIVVDNASTDGSVLFVKQKHPNAILVENGSNVGFGHACNIGAQHAKGKYLLFLNPDTVAQEDLLAPLVGFLESRTSAGIVGPKIVHEDGTLQLSCGKLPSIAREAMDKVLYSLARKKNSLIRQWNERAYSVETEVEWVTGAALMVRAELFRTLGGFDTAMFMYFEDKDLCKRVREHGYGVWFTPGVSVVHLLGKGSAGNTSALLREIYRKSQRYYYGKHHGRIQQWLLALYQGVST